MIPPAQLERLTNEEFCENITALAKNGLCHPDKIIEAARRIEQLAKWSVIWKRAAKVGYEFLPPPMRWMGRLASAVCRDRQDEIRRLEYELFGDHKELFDTTRGHRNRETLHELRAASQERKPTDKADQ